MVSLSDKPASGLDGVARPHADVIDVAQYSFGRWKMAAGLVALATWLATLWWLFLPYVMGQATPIDNFLGKIGRGYLWGEDSLWAQTYANQCLTKNYFGCSGDTTPFEFIVLQFHASPKSYIVPMFALGLVAICAFAWFFMRRPAPVRFNRKIGAVYGVSAGKFWILPAADFDFVYRGEWDPLSGQFNSSGPMTVWLRNARKPPQKRKFALGAYPPDCDEYGKQLGAALQHFLAGKPDDERIANAPDHMPLKWWESSLFGVACLPGDIDTKAERWLKNGH